MEEGGRLPPMAAELVDCLAVLVAVRRFPSMGDVVSRSLRSDSYVRMQHFVRRTTYVRFRRFLGGESMSGMCDVNSCSSSWNYFEFLPP
jgi:hypothetical protein